MCETIKYRVWWNGKMYYPEDNEGWHYDISEVDTGEVIGNIYEKK